MSTVVAFLYEIFQFLKSRLVDVDVAMNSGTIREITTNAWWTSYGVLHFPRDKKIKGVAVSVLKAE